MIRSHLYGLGCLIIIKPSGVRVLLEWAAGSPAQAHFDDGIRYRIHGWGQ
jgi:hypothetical protein